MLEFFFNSDNLPFTIAIIIVIVLGTLEGVTTIIGVGMSSLVDAALPDFDFDADVDVDLDVDADVDVDADAGVLESHSLFLRVLGWTGIGRVPLMVLLVLMLSYFGMLGLATQRSVHGWFGFYVPWWLAVVPIFIITMPLVRISANWIGNMIPKEETSAVSVDTFIGRVATITIGRARSGNPAEAKLKDQHGRTHYVMVEPDDAGDTYDSGTQVILVRRDGARFRVIRNESTAMVDRAALGH